MSRIEPPTLFWFLEVPISILMGFCEYQFGLNSPLLFALFGLRHHLMLTPSPPQEQERPHGKSDFPPTALKEDLPTLH